MESCFLSYVMVKTTARLGLIWSWGWFLTDDTCHLSKARVLLRKFQKSSQVSTVLHRNLVVLPTLKCFQRISCFCTTRMHYPTNRGGVFCFFFCVFAEQYLENSLHIYDFRIFLSVIIPNHLYKSSKSGKLYMRPCSAMKVFAKPSHMRTISLMAGLPAIALACFMALLLVVTSDPCSASPTVMLRTKAVPPSPVSADDALIRMIDYMHIIKHQQQNHFKALMDSMKSFRNKVKEAGGKLTKDLDNHRKKLMKKLRKPRIKKRRRLSHRYRHKGGKGASQWKSSW